MTLAQDIDTVMHYNAEMFRQSRPRYDCWDGGTFNHEGSPAWAVDRPAPNPTTVHQMFCTGLVQLDRRKLGLAITKHHSVPGFDGGMVSIHDHFKNVAIPFSLDKASRGALAYVPFGLRGANFEGHVCVLTGGPDDPVWQSFAWSCRVLEPGLTNRYTLRESHDGGFYTLLVPARYAWTPKSSWN